MADKTFDQMTFADFLAVARRHLDQMEACYRSGLEGDGHVEEFSELHKDAGWALALAGSRGTADLRDIETASEGSMVPEDVDGLPAELVAVLTDGTDLWEIAEADEDPVGAAPDASMEAFCQRKIAAADDGLMGIFGATSEIAGPQEDREDDTADRHDEWVEDWNRAVRGVLPDRDDIRDQHPFPIDLSDADGEDF
ncbi:hypothetical protein [Nocardiopsis synnemataformans]|uniref:hypothetical protein n=1 Tax=Nocardiopsis synnemataformans TaxID=61305 RepID=UPI003EBBA71A